MQFPAANPDLGATGSVNLRLQLRRGLSDSDPAAECL